MSSTTINPYKLRSSQIFPATIYLSIRNFPMPDMLLTIYRFILLNCSVIIKFPQIQIHIANNSKYAALNFRYRYLIFQNKSSALNLGLYKAYILYIYIYIFIYLYIYIYILYIYIYIIYILYIYFIYIYIYIYVWCRQHFSSAYQ